MRVVDLLNHSRRRWCLLLLIVAAGLEERMVEIKEEWSVGAAGYRHERGEA